MASFTVNRFEDKERVIEDKGVVVTSVVAEVIGDDSTVGTVFLHDQKVFNHYSAEDCHGRSHSVDDVESGIDYIKKVYEESENEKANLRVEYSKIVDNINKYASVPEDLYVNNGNVRIYLNNIFLNQQSLDLTQGKLDDIEASKSTDEYASIPNVLKDVIEEKVAFYKAEISKLQQAIDKESDYLKSDVEVYNR